MHRLLASKRPAQFQVRQIGDHLVGIHVGLGARAGLPDRQREMLVELARCDAGRSLFDGLRQVLRQRAETSIGARRRELLQAEGMDQTW